MDFSNLIGSDFVDDSGNKYLNIGQLNNSIQITQRNNFDCEVDKHGNKLIDFCDQLT